MTEQCIASLLVLAIMIIAMLLIANLITTEQAISAILRSVAVVILASFVVCEVQQFVSGLLLPWLTHVVPLLASAVKILLVIIFLLVVTVIAMRTVKLNVKSSQTRKHP